MLCVCVYVYVNGYKPGLAEGLRNKMGQSAVDAALAVKYVGAGTVEFLFDPDSHKYYFMEMNTRLQVEHPVTEMIVKRDLVQWQLHVASGNTLPAKQSDLLLHGHSIEARIYAEDPFNNFSSSSGKLHYLRFPERVPESVRVETGVRQGDTITPYYDSMIAKVIAHSDSSRKDALLKLHQCLEDFQVGGICTNIEFLKKTLIHPKFITGGVTTNFIPTHRQELLVPGKIDDMAYIVAALSKLFVTKQTLRRTKADMKASHVWYSDDMIGFTTTGAMQSYVELLPTSGSGGGSEEQNQRLKFGNKSWEVENVRLDSENHLVLQLKNAKLRYQVVTYDNCITVFMDGKRYDFEYPDYELQFESAWEKNLEGWVMPDLSELDAEVAKVVSTIECDVKNVNVANGSNVKTGYDSFFVYIFIS
ncbi:methylcrotonyl-CoA carboxylase, partial [Reticulomyxa filosa]